MKSILICYEKFDNHRVVLEERLYDVHCFIITSMIRAFTPDRYEKTLNSKPALTFVRSENKIRSIWRYLKRYEDPMFVEARIQESYPSVAPALRKKKSQHIADCIRQSEAYFKTAASSDLSIKPLILYYGMLDLAKALMILGDNQLTLDDGTLKAEGLNSHGLTHATKDTADQSIRDSIDDLLNEFCYTSRGSGSTVFSLLHECWSPKKPSKGLRIALGDLLSSHPATWQGYASHTNEAPKYFKAESTYRTTAKGYEHFLKFDPLFQFNTYGVTPGSAIAGNTWLQQQMPRLGSLYSGDTTYSSYGYIHVGLPTSLQDYQPTYKTTTGESYTLADIIPGLPFHPIEIEFLTMFILGSLARYAPQKWLSNVEYRDGGEMFVVEGIIDSAAVSFPKMILEELDDKSYTFTGDSSYFG